MFTSTLLRSGLARFLIAPLVGLPMMLAISTARSDGIASALPVSQVKALSGFVRSLVHARVDMPVDRTATVTWYESPTMTMNAAAPAITGVAVIRFAGVTNSYCRLVASVDGVAGATLVEVPAEANFDACKKSGPLRRLDINGDGVEDILFTVTLKSNRASILVQETMVFFGNGEAAGGYCYSSEASQQFTPDDLRSEQAATAAAGRALGRLGKQRFTCDRL